jgi:hypothetical protein
VTSSQSTSAYAELDRLEKIQRAVDERKARSFLEWNSREVRDGWAKLDAERKRLKP